MLYNVLTPNLSYVVGLLALAIARNCVS
jgi:hypothetical protein